MTHNVWDIKGSLCGKCRQYKFTVETATEFGEARLVQDLKENREIVSLCESCHCMSHDIYEHDGIHCGKCGAVKSVPPPPPKCGFSADGKSVCVCLALDCPFCTAYNDASFIFHTVRRMQSTDGIKRLMEWKGSFKEK